ncbi:cytochrome P450 [Mycena latifolia]|nr:cytochrome P450 [Mycena latifolia]
MVILNSAADAFNLLSKCSAIYSDRPFPTMGGVLMRREKSLFHISHNNRFKTYRRMLHQSLNPNASKMYWHQQEREARVLVDNIIKSPQDLAEHIRRNAAAVIMQIAYGYSVTQNDDHFVTHAEEMMKIRVLAAAPGKWVVDSIPFLRFIPAWVPGAGFKTKAEQWSQQIHNQVLEPYAWVKEQMAMGVATPSFTSRLLQPSDGSLVNTEIEENVFWLTEALYVAGADTTASAMKTFFFTMMMYPLVQQRAQDEADSFFASENRLPTLNDRAAFPYIDSILKELLRWAPPAPVGLFHSNAEDDTYNGYFIPKNTTIVANIWAMMHDESVYPDPFTFEPTRFLGEAPQPDPRGCVFGFGRRVCPGQSLAENSIWIQMVLSLLTLTISKALDANGRPIEPEISFTTALISHVKPFQYQITPRSTGAYSHIEKALENSA